MRGAVDVLKAMMADQQSSIIGSMGDSMLADANIKKGYVPDSDSDESVTETQGYWFADVSISEAAKALGKMDDAKKLAARSQGYRKLFNKETEFFQPKDSSGNFEAGFDPISWKTGLQ